MKEYILEYLEKELLSVKYQSSRNSIFSPPSFGFHASGSPSAPDSTPAPGFTPAPGSTPAPVSPNPITLFQEDIRILPDKFQPPVLQPSILQPLVLHPSNLQPSNLLPSKFQPIKFDFYVGGIHQPPDILGGLVEIPNHGASSNLVSDLQKFSDNPSVSGISLNKRNLGVVPLARLTGEGVDLFEQQYVQVKINFYKINFKKNCQNVFYTI